MKLNFQEKLRSFVRQMRLFVSRLIRISALTRHFGKLCDTVIIRKMTYSPIPVTRDLRRKKLGCSHFTMHAFFVFGIESD